jgi:hypothetical protein
MNHPIPAVVMALAALALPAAAQTPLAEAGTTVTLVRVAKPWYAPRALVAGKMRETIAEYDKLPGLVYKVYTIAQEDGRYGGLYLWRDRASAEQWFNPAWFARVEKERGVAGEVRTFAAARVADYTPGGTRAAPKSDAVATVLLLPTAAAADAGRRSETLRGTLPARPDGLLREYWIAGAGSAGLALLWRDEASARAALDGAWSGRAATAVGTAPVAEWYDAPVLTPSVLPANRLQAN